MKALTFIKKKAKSLNLFKILEIVLVVKVNRHMVLYKAV